MKKMYQIIRNSLFIHSLDKRGIRIFTAYSSMGGFRIHLYRKRTKLDPIVPNNWCMIYVSSLISFDNRIDAENEAIKKAKELIRIYNY